MFHAKRFGFFGTVLACTVLLTACPRVGINPITTPGYLNMGIDVSVLKDFCTQEFVERLYADAVLIYDTQKPEESLLKRPSGLGGLFYRIPREMRTGSLLKIEMECYGKNQELIERYNYEGIIQYPVFAKPGAFLDIRLSPPNSPDDCIVGKQEPLTTEDQPQLCIYTNLFAEK